MLFCFPRLVSDSDEPLTVLLLTEQNCLYHQSRRRQNLSAAAVSQTF